MRSLTLSLVAVLVIAGSAYGLPHEVLPAPNSRAIGPVSKAPQAQQLTVFDLIDRAHQEGKIDHEQALIYKAYAVRDWERLPEKFKSGANAQIKSGTPIILEIFRQWDSLSPETQDQLRFLKARPFSGGYKVESTNYIVHYQSAGLASYCSSISSILEYSWGVETGMGYNPPPDDGWIPGDNGGDGRYDVYVYNLGGGVLGYTSPEYLISGPPTNDATSYIAITTGLSTSYQQVTSAHEMFHSIQFTYDYQESLWWMEATAVWMEEQVYDAVNDYINYLPYFMNIPEVSLDNEDGLHPYADCIWPLYLHENFGADIMREIWERCDDVGGGNSIGDNNYVLMNNYGSSFVDEYATFTNWNYICGSNDDGAHYDEGSMFPDVAIEKVHWAYPVENASVTNTPEQYGCNYITCYLDGTPGTTTVEFNGDTMFEFAVFVITVTPGGVYTSNEMTLNAWQNGTLDILNSENYSRIVLVVANIGTSDNADYLYSVDAPGQGQECYDLAYHDGGAQYYHTFAAGDQIGTLFTVDPSYFPFEIREASALWYDPDAVYSSSCSLHVYDQGMNKLLTLPITLSGASDYNPNWHTVDLSSYDIVLSDTFVVAYEITQPDSTPFPLSDGSMHTTDPHSLWYTDPGGGYGWYWIGQSGTPFQYIDFMFESLICLAPTGGEFAGQEIVISPSGTVLKQNSPNPFNPSTEISFFVEDDHRNAPMTLEVFNTSGQKVRTLLEGPAPGGYQSVRWDGTDDGGLAVSSGVYFYKLVVGDRSEARQMILLK